MVPVCPLGKSSIVKGTAAELLLPGSKQCLFSRYSAAFTELDVQDRGFPQRRTLGGRPPAQTQTCRDGGAPGELGQRRGEVR